MPLPGSGPRRTALYDVHVALGARMVPFAGHEMPLSYMGAVAEHVHTRSAASLFDVSHMWVCDIVGDEVPELVERLTPSTVTDLVPGQCRYITLTNAGGGVVDDTIVTRLTDRVRLVLNAGASEAVLSHLQAHLGDAVMGRPDLALLAVQGPMADTALRAMGIDTRGLVFMRAKWSSWRNHPLTVSRSGYTGEDGFELLAESEVLPRLATALLDHDAVEPAGLAARDSLRIEAGLCLYGNELDEHTSPIEAGLVWTIPPARRVGGRYLGADVVTRHISEGPPRRLVGLRPDGRRPLRAGNQLHDLDGVAVGEVTSGVWGATAGVAVALGYVASHLAAEGTVLVADVRGREQHCIVTKLPFVTHRYVRRAGS
jgi:aminomethyltransferase